MEIHKHPVSEPFFGLLLFLPQGLSFVLKSGLKIIQNKMLLFVRNGIDDLFIKRTSVPKIAIKYFAIVFALFLGACNHDNSIRYRVNYIDTLNIQSYIFKYKNIDSAQIKVDAVLGSNDASSLQRAYARNTMAAIKFMQMDYRESENLCQMVYDDTNSEIERLVADVGMMRICQRTSDNKRFFDYRTNALKHLKRIYEETSELNMKDNFRLSFAELSLHLVSATYYNDFVLKKPYGDEMGLIEPSEALQSDSSQWLYYLYMKGIGKDRGDADETTYLIERYSDLNKCLQIAQAGSYRWFEASALQALSELMLENGALATLNSRRPNSMSRLGADILKSDFLPTELAKRALNLFAEYGDEYKVIDSYRTLGSCYNRSLCFDSALVVLNEALQHINCYRKNSAACRDSSLTLSLYEPGDSAELLWLKYDDVPIIPECLLQIREEISLAFAGVKNKAASDYNRNIYLDLLQQVRQNREYESRAMGLERETDLLNRIFMALLLGILVTIISAFFLGHYWQKRNKKYVLRLRVILKACKLITTSVSSSDVTMQEMANGIADSVKPCFNELFGTNGIRIEVAQNEGEENGEMMADGDNGDVGDDEKCAVSCFDLLSPFGGHATGRLLMHTRHPLSHDDKAAIALMLPYFAIAVENGLIFLKLGDEYRRIEKEHYLYQKHLAANKCENVVKKACLSIVTGITPYMDRIVNEVRKLLNTDNGLSEEDRLRKYEYINELTDKINEYNDILSSWIKMRQGALSLQVENFSLAPLFAILQKSRQTFESHRLTFTVEPADVVVKADKALTLFMMNTLAENARKYTPSGGSVTVRAAEYDDYVEISVCDTGVGLSQVDIARILGEKVYDSRLIGSDNSERNEIVKNKGFGFGILNCKGIIEKYRKSDTLFKVCRFGIESEVGKGSRFFFRLPKGVMRNLISLLAVLFAFTMPSFSANTDGSLQNIRHYANSVYMKNVECEYSEALLYADSAIQELNNYYIIHGGDSLHLLSLNGQGEAAELEWLDMGFAQDSLFEEVYFNILDIRNEVAVASLALNEWNMYNYNNRAYESLYLLAHEDNSLEIYCENMQRSAAGKQVLIVLCFILLLIVLVVSYLLYFRQWLLYRLNMRQVVEINRQLFSHELLGAQEANDAALIAQRVVERLFPGMNDLLSIGELVVAVYSDEKQRLFSASSSKEREQATELRTLINRCYETKLFVANDNGTLQCFPLLMDLGDTKQCLGVIGYALNGREQENERLMSELVTSYAAVLIYNTVVKLAHKYRDIEQIQDDARRVIHEENKLHVQNLVLDNCLSIIKHETVYYPSRIKQIVSHLLDSNKVQKENENELVHSMSELIGYYKDVFTTLSICASRQLDEITFRRSNVPVASLGSYAADYANRMANKLKRKVTFENLVGSEVVMGDEYLLQFLFQNLVDGAMNCDEAGKLILRSVADGSFVRISFTDTRQHYSDEQLSQLFMPTLKRIYSTDDGQLKGSEYLICKQIIREHDEYIGHRGCRIEACNDEECGGFTVWFTIPRKK